MHVALFIVYFLLCCFAINRMRFFKGLVKPFWMLLLFSLHVAAGCIHTWIAWRFFPNHGDIWNYFNEGIGYKKALLDHPQIFLSQFFSSSLFNITDTTKPLLDIQYQALQYANALLNFFSAENFYINTLLFSFPVFAGTIALFKTFYSIYKNPLPAICTVLLPSVLFWTAVLYKDSLFYMAIGFFYYYYQINRAAGWKAFLLLLFILLMGLSRANALITLLPAMAFYFLAEKKSFSRMRSAGIVLAGIVLITIACNALVTGGILSGISNRQNDFQSLSGGSRIYLPSLHPTAGSFLVAFPWAVINGFFQPLPGSGGKSIYLAFSVELILVWLIILWACWLLVKRKDRRLSNFDISCLIFALPGLIMIGYIVPFAGAIIRYRSIYLPFLLAPFLNVICSYPAGIAAGVNQWLSKYVVITEVNKLK